MKIVTIEQFKSINLLLSLQKFHIEPYFHTVSYPLQIWSTTNVYALRTQAKSPRKGYFLIHSTTKIAALRKSVYNEILQENIFQ